MRRLLSIALLLEGVLAAVDLSRIVPSLLVHRGSVIAVVCCRALVSVAQLMAYAALGSQRNGAERFAAAVLASSAIVRAFEIGLQMAPNDVAPGMRWPTVGLYAVYAGAASAYWLRRRRSCTVKP